jgi:hypothetical protein
MLKVIICILIGVALASFGVVKSLNLVGSFFSKAATTTEGAIEKGKSISKSVEDKKRTASKSVEALAEKAK